MSVETNRSMPTHWRRKECVKFCQEDDGTDSVYIGEAENVLNRLTQHLQDFQTGKEKYYWNTAVIFVGRDLNKALIRYLENRFAEIAKACSRLGWDIGGHQRTNQPDKSAASD